MVGSTGISFSGLASGIDTQAIVRQLVQLERLPIDALQARRASEQKKLDLVGQFGDLVKKLKERAEALETPGLFKSSSATLSDETVGTVSASADAIPGSHTLEVLQLAATDRWAFDPVTSRDMDLAGSAGQQISFTVGLSAFSLVVDPASSSLDEIAAEINEMAGEEVHASVVNTGTAANPSFQLVLASKVAGEDGRITNLFSDVGGGADDLTITWAPPGPGGEPASAANITVGNDARALIDGLLVRRADNDFSDVLEGVSLTVSRLTTPGAPVHLSVEPDKEAIRGKIDEFVEAYNAVIDFIETQSTFTPSPDPEDNGGTTGLLFGDSLVGNVRRSITRALFDVDLAAVASDVEGYSTLSLVGISQDRDGKLSIDDAKFDAKFAANLDALVDLFTDSDGFDNGGAAAGDPGYYVDQSEDAGLMAKLVREIDRMFGTLAGSTSSLTLRGAFDARQDAIKERMKLFDEDIERKESRIERFEEGLILQFARFEQLMSTLNAQGASLNNALMQFSG